MSDLAQRLRNFSEGGDWRVLDEAADRIEKLERTQITPEMRERIVGYFQEEETMYRESPTKILRDILAATTPEEDRMSELFQAVELATAIWERGYKNESPEWEPLDDVSGVITQIDNMTAGLFDRIERLKRERDEARELAEIQRSYVYWKYPKPFLWEPK